jgi:hypothetical protein
VSSGCVAGTLRQALASAALLLVFAPRSAAQVVQLSGGSSSLMETQGGSVQVDSENAHGTLSLGWHDGLRTGFLAESTFNGTKLSVGDSIIPFVLPTDVFDTSYYLWARGIGLRRPVGGGDALVFAGYTSESLNTPFVNTATPDDPVAAFFYRRPLGRRFKFGSFNLLSRRLTSIQSVEWMPIRDLNFAASAGVGYQQPYGAVSARFHRNKVDVWASESVSTDSFRRIRLVSPLMTEQKGANVRVEYRPWRDIGVSLSRQDLLAPVTGGNTLEARVYGANGWFSLAGTRVNNSLFHSVGPSGPIDASLSSVERSFANRFDVRVEYFHSRSEASGNFGGLTSTFRERINAHISISQSVFSQSSQHTISFGGQFVSNSLEVSADYQTIFVPFVLPGQSPFRQVLSLNFRGRVWKDMDLHAATNYTPLGQTRYTTYVTDELYSDGARLVAAGRSAGRSIPPYLIRGVVRDHENQPVFGAAIIVDRQQTFTDSDGVFVVRKKKSGDYELKVDVANFLFPGNVFVISAPEKVRARLSNVADTVTIRVQRTGSPNAKDVDRGVAGGQTIAKQK